MILLKLTGSCQRKQDMRPWSTNIEHPARDAYQSNFECAGAPRLLNEYSGRAGFMRRLTRFSGHLMLTQSEVFNMTKKQPVYTPEFRRQMVELHRVGRGFEELSKEFGVTSWTIRQWVKQADRDAGRGDGGLTTAERQELVRLRRENRQLKLEREILSKAAAWFANESTANRKHSSDS